MREVIACLEYQDGSVVRSVNFEGRKEMGDPIEFGRKYQEAGVDRLVFLDTSRTVKPHQLLTTYIKELGKEIRVPLVVGGVIATLNEIEMAMASGARQVSIASKALEDPSFVRQACKSFGSWKIIVAIDYRKEDGDYWVYSQGGRKKSQWRALDWIKECQEMGAGELLLTSMDQDGVQTGFDLDFLKLASEVVDIPLIASGGAGQVEDFVDLFEQTKVQSALAASIFHQDFVEIAEVKARLKEKGVRVKA